MTIESKKTSAMREDAVKIFYKALQAVQPGDAIRRHLRYDGKNLFIGDRVYYLPRFKHLFVVGAGKAAASMAAAIEDIIGHYITEGIVIVKYGHVVDLNRIKVIEAGHPMPDEKGRYGASAILNLIKKAKKDDLVICLISGGGSALMPLPYEGLTLKDKQNANKVLLSCGASIHEINTIRKHTSKIKGGRLADAAYPATLVTLILSDVVGDDLDVIEIDGASNNSVENVRDLRENAIYRPARCRFKIYIIDEVHMLSVSAFNALLKTLEEPPSHVKFIFATTEPNKVLATIQSRCQRFDFRNIAPASIAKQLKIILDQEKSNTRKT